MPQSDEAAPLKKAILSAAIPDSQILRLARLLPKSNSQGRE